MALQIYDLVHDIRELCLDLAMQLLDIVLLYHFFNIVHFIMKWESYI